MNAKANKNAKSGLRMLAIMAGVLLIAGMMASAAFASVDPTDIKITAGTLNISSMTVGDFADFMLTGSATDVTAAMTPFTLTDARGSGAGWHITAQATQFSEYLLGVYVSPGGKTLATSSLSMPAPTVAANGTSSAVPTITAGPNAIDSGSAVTIASAAADADPGAGMGAYNFTPGSLSLSIPANAYATTYRSEVTVSAVTGP